MGWLASLPQYATVLAVLIGGVVIDRIPRERVPLIFVFGSLGVTLSVLVAIAVADPYSSAYSLIAANFFWGLQSPAIPSTVQYHSRPEHIASTFGVVNGAGALASAFMPLVMGWAIGFFAQGQANQGVGFQAGFIALTCTQLVVFACGWLLWRREKRQESLIPPALPERSA